MVRVLTLFVAALFYLPIFATSGTIIANGLGAYEFAPRSGYNAFNDNVVKLTANTINYLSSKRTGHRPAMFIAAENIDWLDAQEAAAARVFRQLYPSGMIITPSTIGSVTPDVADCIWIHIDRCFMGNGVGNLPECFRNINTISVLRRYVAAGGSLFLSKFAVELLVPLGRISEQFAPNIYNDGDGGLGYDNWTIQANVGICDPSQSADHRWHPIYNGMAVCGDYPWETYPLLGSGNGSALHREDHTCVWELGVYDYASDGRNPVERFEHQNNAVVLGQWGHVQDFFMAGIVEFLPMNNTSYAGTVIANGIGGYELRPRSGVNAFNHNVRQLTVNTLEYLASKRVGRRMALLTTDTDVDDIEEPQEAAAAALFKEIYPNGTLITSIDAAKISIKNFDCIWIHIDRSGLERGWEKLPVEYRNAALVSALRQFVADGGCLFLSKYATQLLVAIGRTDAVFSPNVHYNSTGALGYDNWTVQARIGCGGHPDYIYDQRYHPIYNNLTVCNDYPWETFPLLGSGDGSALYREDHTSVWNLADYPYRAAGNNDVERFEAENSATVLGQWGHLQDHSNAAIVEFHPTVETTQPEYMTLAPLTYRIVDKANRTCLISGQQAASGDLVVPATVAPNNALTYTIIGVDQDAFRGASKLSSITLPSTATTIGNNAFYGCSNLRSFKADGMLTEVGTSAFYNCKALENLNFTTTIGSIPDQAFYGCSNLRGFDIPASVSSIGTRAFYMSGLEYVNIKAGITQIGSEAFEACPNLMSFGVEPQNNVFSELSGVLFDKYASTLLLYPSGRSGEYTIPYGVNTIGNRAFCQVAGLSSIHMPETLVNIGTSAFSNCSSLANVAIARSVRNIADHAFYNCKSLAMVDIPPMLQSLGSYVFTGCDALTNIHYFTTTPVEAYQYNFSTNTMNKGVLHVAPGGAQAAKSTNPWMKIKTIEEDSYDNMDDISISPIQSSDSQYFTIDGRPVPADNLQHGIYILKRGNTTQKVVR